MASKSSIVLLLGLFGFVAWLYLDRKEEVVLLGNIDRSIPKEIAIVNKTETRLPSATFRENKSSPSLEHNNFISKKERQGLKAQEEMMRDEIEPLLLQLNADLSDVDNRAVIKKEFKAITDKNEEIVLRLALDAIARENLAEGE